LYTIKVARRAVGAHLLEVGRGLLLRPYDGVDAAEADKREREPLADRFGDLVTDSRKGGLLGGRPALARVPLI
jgi:hypothetical protein